MLKIGHADLGSTHPEKFIEAEKRLGYIPYGVYDDYRIFDRDYVNKFADKHGLIVFKSLDDMAKEVDVAFIHSVNWDLHFGRIMPFIDRGKGVYVDKPICGNLRDIAQIKSLFVQGSRISGGSMVIYCDELVELHKEQEFINDVNIVFTGGPKDIFFYGIHVFYLVCGVLGFDIKSVRFISESGQKMYELTWQNGKKAVIAIGNTTKYFPFHMTLLTPEKTRQYNIKAFLALENMLKQVIPYLVGQDVPITGIDKMLNCEKGAIAALVSEEHGGETVILDELNYSGSYNGYEYERLYKSVL